MVGRCNVLLKIVTLQTCAFSGGLVSGRLPLGASTILTDSLADAACINKVSAVKLKQLTGGTKWLGACQNWILELAIKGDPLDWHVSPQEIAGPNSRPYEGKPMVKSPLIRPAISWEGGLALVGPFRFQWLHEPLRLKLMTHNIWWRFMTFQTMSAAKTSLGPKVLIREASFLFGQLVPNSWFEKITLTERLNQGSLKVNRESVAGDF